MSASRKISKVWKSKPTIEGAGVHLKRAFGFQEAPLLDPFLLLDDFHSGNPSHYLPGFPWHPHRGIETITYVHHGRVEHGDSMGNRGVIDSGDIQWMTAGSGIVHQEMPKGDEQGLMWGFQLWANLPAANKMMAPRYRGIVAAQVPETTLPGNVRVKVICGKAGSVQGPVQDITVDPEYLDVSIPMNTTFTHPCKRKHTVFAYVIEGEGYFDFKQSSVCGAENLVYYGDGDQVTITTQDKSLRFLLISGKPIGEPIAWYGPIVMNTQEELQTAFEEYANGTFIKHPAPPGSNPASGKQD